MQPESIAIDDALVATLQGDASLTALLQPGACVFFDEAPAGSTACVIVSLVDELDIPDFSGRAIEDALYLVKVVALSPTDTIVRAAAARIDALLDGERLTARGYACLRMSQESRLHFTETDDFDATIVWQHCGGHYRVMMAVQPAGADAPSSGWIAPGWVSDGWAA